MIDLRKPLEGVPGLLLMAALILFGAGVGIAFALGFTWIPMSDALANFLGGVVGAGLGAALAVMGAVYVQRSERSELRRVAGRHLYPHALELLMTLVMLQHNLRHSPPEDMVRSVKDNHDKIARALVAMPNGADVTAEVATTVMNLKQHLTFIMAAAGAVTSDTLERRIDGGPNKGKLVYATDIDEACELASSLTGHLRALLRE